VKIWLASLFLLLYSATTVADGTLLPDRFSVVYRLSQAGITLAELERKGRLAEDGSYIIESVASPRGMAAWILSGTTEERSQWILKNGNVTPLRYTYRENGGSRKKSMDLEYDWDKGIAIDHNSGKQWKLPKNTQDQTSLQFAIMEGLRRGEREFHYPQLDGKRIKHRHYRVTEKKMLDTKVGRIEVIGVREVKPEGKRYSLFWCAPRFGYLRVRIEQHKKGSPSLITVIEKIRGFLHPHYSPLIKTKSSFIRWSDNQPPDK